jgi:hypothetical protein
MDVLISAIPGRSSTLLLLLLFILCGRRWSLSRFSWHFSWENKYWRVGSTPLSFEWQPSSSIDSVVISFLIGTTAAVTMSCFFTDAGLESGAPIGILVNCPMCCQHCLWHVVSTEEKGTGEKRSCYPSIQ